MSELKIKIKLSNGNTFDITTTKETTVLELKG